MPRLADPHAELPVKNFKYVTNCTELHLSKRGVERIANFESFVNLEVLWINENEVSRQIRQEHTCSEWLMRRLTCLFRT